MKNRFILLLLLLMGFTGCKLISPGTRNSDNMTAGSASNPEKGSSPKFIQGISTGSAASGDPEIPSAAPLYRTGSSKLTPASSSESVDMAELQFKYAILMNTPVEELTNQRLLVFMDQWYGVPYHYGGSTKEGIDCSAFASLLIADVYNVNQLPRISSDQYNASRRVSRTHLKAGDLVFFHTLGKGHRVTHVGVYLYNNRFVHASVNGVQISDLDEGYYKKHYVGAGRVVQE